MTQLITHHSRQPILLYYLTSTIFSGASTFSTATDRQSSQDGHHESFSFISTVRDNISSSVTPAACSATAKARFGCLDEATAQPARVAQVSDWRGSGCLE